MTQSQDERLGMPSASSWRRYELCAGSWQLETEARVLGQSAHESSPAALRGSLIHAYLAGVVDEDGTEIKLNESEQQTADFLQARAQEQADRIFGDAKTLDLVEKRLWLIVNGAKRASGQFDRCIYSVDGKLALIQDFKSGQSEPIEAETSSQMRVLAVLVGLALPNVKEIVVQVITVFYGVSERRFSIAELAEAYRDIVQTLHRLEDPCAPLIPGPMQCRWCPAINVCSAVKKLTPQIAKLEVSALPDGVLATELLDKVKILEGLIEQIKKYYAERLTADPSYVIPSYAMKPGNKMRKVIDWKTAKARLAEYLDDDQLNKAADYGIVQLEAALAKTLKISKDQAKTKFDEILLGLIEEKENKPSLKRTSNKAQVIVQLP
jgi:Protein of unknown function (DUF2800)